MDEERKGRIDRIMAVYWDALDDYDVPITRALVKSRERLTRFIGWDAPCIIIDREIELLEKKLLEIQKSRIKTLH